MAHVHARCHVQCRGSSKAQRLHVGFAFDGLDDAQRYTFMKRFDLYMQRGGG